MPPQELQPNTTPSHGDPLVVLIGNASTANQEQAQLDLACRFHGFRLAIADFLGKENLLSFATATPPVLVVWQASALRQITIDTWHKVEAWAEQQHVAIAIVGVTPECDQALLARIAGSESLRTIAATPDASLWVPTSDPAYPGFVLRGVQLGLGPGQAYGFSQLSHREARVLTSAGSSESESIPSCLRLERPYGSLFLLSSLRTSTDNTDRSWTFQRAQFGEIVPWFLLIREVGGKRCWHAAAAFANLTIDDPWLIDPYGCLSFPGLLAEMKRERFHATIGFVPWNYDRSRPNVVALLRDHPEYYSIAVHGNNHDHYEFFRYEARPEDRQRGKSLATQTYNIRQATARMEEFSRRTGLDYDRVMVFPHGICPGPTFQALKDCGFWATSNYNNVPLGEHPPDDLVVALRSANACWSDLPAVRRMYPHNYSDEAIAVDLFLGNPVLFMGHQDTFFFFFFAFNPYAKRLNTRQPSVRWAGLGEISRHLHLQRWLDDGDCEIRLVSQHARISNLKPDPAVFRLAKPEPNSGKIVRVTVDGAETPWAFADGELRFNLTLPSHATALVEIHYQHPTSESSVDLKRRGFRNRTLRLISDFRDLTLARSLLGRLLTRTYYRPGKKRPTVSSMLRGLFSK